MTREDLITDFIYHMDDSFPYDDPLREEKLLAAAEHYADEVLNPDSDLNQLCSQHDEMLELNELEF